MSANPISTNCAPVASSEDGTLVWYSRAQNGCWDAYYGYNLKSGVPLLPPHNGNRAPSDITKDGRYVLLTSAVGWDSQLSDSGPGQGSGNAIQLYDFKTSKVSTLLVGGIKLQRGVIWPKFNSDATKIVWSQLIKTEAEIGGRGQWQINIANIDLEAVYISNIIKWEDPNGLPAFYECYGWVPNTDLIIFASSTRSTTKTLFREQQLFTLNENLGLNPPTRISPKFIQNKQESDVFHEFAFFAPNNNNLLYTCIGAETDGGDDIFVYDLSTKQKNGILSQPKRISYFGGENFKQVNGWPKPSPTYISTMAKKNNAWLVTTSHQLLSNNVEAWEIYI